ADRPHGPDDHRLVLGGRGDRWPRARRRRRLGRRLLGPAADRERREDRDPGRGVTGALSQDPGGVAAASAFEPPRRAWSSSTGSGRPFSETPPISIRSTPSGVPAAAAAPVSSTSPG